MIKILEWDSEHFGFNIAELGITTPVKDLGFVERFVKSNDVDFLQARCEICDVNLIQLLETHGFHFADLRIEYILKSNPLLCDNKDGFHLADDNDIPALRTIARTLTANSRYFGSGFDEDKIDRLYEIWLEKSVAGKFDDLCVKIGDGSVPIGFSTVRFIDKKRARIGIIGVDVRYRNMGIGSKLMNAVFGVMKHNKLEMLEVATQGRNVPAQNFYIKNGFRIKNIQSWYYKFVRKGDL